MKNFISFIMSSFLLCYFFRDIQSTTGKIKRAVLQFTPGSWTHVRWLDPKCTYMRFFALCQLVVFWQISELNTFFLKHIFEMPPAHFLVVGRLGLIGLIVAPSVRYVSYLLNILFSCTGKVFKLKTEIMHSNLFAS